MKIHKIPRKSNQATTKQLAWQLRSGKLRLVDGKVVPYPQMLITCNSDAKRIILWRCDAINQIIEQADIHPACINDLVDYFAGLENEEEIDHG